MVTDSALSVCLYHPIHGQTLDDEILIYLNNISCKVMLNYSYHKSALWSSESNHIIKSVIDLASPNYIDDIANVIHHLTTPVFYRYVEYTLLRTHRFRLERSYSENGKVNGLHYTTALTTLHMHFDDNEFKIYDTTHALRKRILWIYKKWLSHVDITRSLRNNNVIDSVINHLKYAVK